MTEKLPDSIRSPEAFMRSAPPAFDGVMDCSWMQACWDNPNDRPMDFDAVKERNGEFLVVETKNPGATVPFGQILAFERLHALGSVSIMLVWGKDRPIEGEFWFPNDKRYQRFVGVEEAQSLVRRWFKWADQKTRPKRSTRLEIPNQRPEATHDE